MSKPLSILIIDKDPVARAVIREAIGKIEQAEILAETDSLIYGYELVRQNHPSIVFLDIREELQQTLETAKRISSFFKEVIVVVSGYDIDIDGIKACMEAGIRDYIPRPFTPRDIKEVFDRHHLALSADGSGDETGRIITVYSNKGGLGKTTIAVNLALALSESVNSPVALVDLNLQLGDITTFLDVEPKQTIVDIAHDIARVDASYLLGSLAEYKSNRSTLYVLADPLHVEDAEDVTSEQINAVLTVLRASFKYVVIDTTTSFDTKTLSALDLADDILMVSMVNLPCIRSSQRLLRLFDRLGYDRQKVKLVVNRYMPGEEITVDDVEETLEHSVFWKIPNTYFVVMSAINRGIPVSMVENSKDITNSFLELSYKLIGIVNPGATKLSGTEVAKSSGILGNLFSKAKTIR
jgi:pilus assembly protein CpaE